MSPLQTLNLTGKKSTAGDKKYSNEYTCPLQLRVRLSRSLSLSLLLYIFFGFDFTIEVSLFFFLYPCKRMESCLAWSWVHIKEWKTHGYRTNYSVFIFRIKFIPWVSVREAMHAIEGKVHTQVVGSFVLKMDSRNCVYMRNSRRQKLPGWKWMERTFRLNTTQNRTKGTQVQWVYRNTRIQFLRILDSGLVSHGWEERSCLALACVTCSFSFSLSLSFPHSTLHAFFPVEFWRHASYSSEYCVLASVLSLSSSLSLLCSECLVYLTPKSRGINCIWAVSSMQLRSSVAFTLTHCMRVPLYL